MLADKNCRQPWQSASNQTKVLLVQHLLCNWFYPGRASNLQKPLSASWRIHISLATKWLYDTQYGLSKHCAHDVTWKTSLEDNCKTALGLDLWILSWWVYGLSHETWVMLNKMLCPFVKLWSSYRGFTVNSVSLSLITSSWCFKAGLYEWMTSQ